MFWYKIYINTYKPLLAEDAPNANKILRNQIHDVSWFAAHKR